MPRRRAALLAAAVLLAAGAAYALTRPPRIEGLDRLPTLRLRLPRLPLPRVVTSGDLRSACVGDEAVRLLAVSIDNHPDARPQAGLDRACLVYELPVEGGATRFEAVYGAGDAPLVGPVRSVRRYTLEIAHELDAVLAHAGQSLEAFRLIRETGWPVVNEFWTRGVFWRDASRRTPHNVYTTTARLRAEMARTRLERPERVAPPDADAGPPPAGRPASGLRVGFIVPYAVEFRYDAARGEYVRTRGEAPERDASGGEVSARTVILQVLPATPIVFPWGEEGVRMPLLGEGRAVLLASGQAIEGRWSKTNLETPTRFTTAEGETVRLPHGRVWVILVPTGTTIQITR